MDRSTIEFDDTVCYAEDGKTLKGATFPKLVALLTGELRTQIFQSIPYPKDTVLMTDFLMTYRSFANDGRHLFSALQERERTSAGEKLVRVRVFNVIKHWIDKYWYDFEKECPQLGIECIEWLAKMEKDETPGSAAATTIYGIKTKLQKALLDSDQMDSKFLVVFPPGTVTPKLILPKDLNAFHILDVDSVEIARHITIIESRLWHAIKTYEFLNLAWTKKDKAQKAGNLLAMIERFNYFSGWVAATVCTCIEPKKRLRIISKLIDIAIKLKAIGNFNGVMEILSGLNRGPVFRLLKDSFGPLAVGKYKAAAQQYQELNCTFSSDRAYSALRAALRDLNPPCIPYVGMYLTDLTFIEEGNKNNITESNLINFHKRHLVAATIKEILVYQAGDFPFDECPQIIAKLLGENIFEEDELYEMSYYHEPRPGKERGPKPATLEEGYLRTKAGVDEKKHIEVDAKNEWAEFLRPCQSSNCETKDGYLISCDLHKLIEYLTHPTRSEALLKTPMVATIPAYTTPERFLSLLMLRFDVPGPKDKSTTSLQEFRDHFQVPIYLHVNELLVIWVTQFWNHFKGNEVLIQQLISFVNGPFQYALPQFASVLNCHIHRQLNGHLLPNPSPPEPLAPIAIFEETKISLSWLDPTEVARQLCLLSWNRFLGCFNTSNFLNFLTPMTHLANTIQMWALCELIKHQQEGQLVLALSTLSAIAMTCFEFGNFHATNAIFAAFEETKNYSTDQFQTEWAAVDLKLSQWVDQIQKEFSTEAQQLQIIQQDHPSDIINVTGASLINIQKMKRVGAIISSLAKYQAIGYHFVEVPVIQKYLVATREKPVASNSLKQPIENAMIQSVLTDPYFVDELTLIVNEVITEEHQKIETDQTKWIRNQILALAMGRPLLTDDTTFLISDPKIRKVVCAAFPGCSFSRWDYFDADCQVSVSPQPISIIAIHFQEDPTRFLLDIKENFTVQEAITLLKIGKLYHQQNDGVPLCCVVVLHQISSQAARIAQKCRIKILSYSG